MRDTMLILHFIGLAMGLGTSIGFMFLGIAGSKMKKEEGIDFSLKTFALSRMGHTGLALLIISGIFLTFPLWNTVIHSTLFMIKLVLVVILTSLVAFIGYMAKKAKAGDAEASFKKIEPIGKISLIIAILIVVLAVFIFH